MLLLLINKNLNRKKEILNIKEKYNKSTYYFINSLFHSSIKDGKKFRNLNFFFKIFYLLKKKYRINLFIFFYFIQWRLHSRIYLKSQHIGIILYLIPVISIRKSIFLSKSWILSGLKERKERTFILRLFSELCDIWNGKGQSLLKKIQYYKIIKQCWANFRFLKYVNIKNKPFSLNKKDYVIMKKWYNRKKIKLVRYNKIFNLKKNKNYAYNIFKKK